jgi:protein-S-isoprenylcysteine O-methyltransferase Ste14
MFVNADTLAFPRALAHISIRTQRGREMLWLRAVFFGVAFVLVVLVWLPMQLLAPTGGPRVTEGPLRYVGFALLALGLPLVIWCWWGFITRGRGTPAPFDPPRNLVVTGPYRFVRNPMYLGAILLLLGEAALWRAPVLAGLAVAFWLIAHVVVVSYEERALARSFGQSYADYRARVKRWLPRWPARSRVPESALSSPPYR